MTIANDSHHIIGTFCGDMTGHAVFVTGIYAEIIFHTDHNIQKSGFEMLFNPVPTRKWKEVQLQINFLLMWFFRNVCVGICRGDTATLSLHLS